MQQTKKLDIAHYENALSRKHQLIRLLWGIVWPLGTFPPTIIGNVLEEISSKGVWSTYSTYCKHIFIG